MTTITTALGLLPLVITSGTGSEVQRPLAIVVIGGLVSSTLLTLIVIPTLYEWITAKSERIVIPSLYESITVKAERF